MPLIFSAILREILYLLELSPPPNKRCPQINAALGIQNINRPCPQIDTASTVWRLFEEKRYLQKVYLNQQWKFIFF